MNRTRTLPGANPVKKKNLAPGHPHEWNQLLLQAIRRAEAISDPKLAGLRRAMVEGQAENFLRKMSILSQTDIDREFPLPSR